MQTLGLCAPGLCAPPRAPAKCEGARILPTQGRRATEAQRIAMASSGAARRTRRPPRVSSPPICSPETLGTPCRHSLCHAAGGLT
eukprot:14627448-Alexandrium_andersonii.AAC.1